MSSSPKDLLVSPTTDDREEYPPHAFFVHSNSSLSQNLPSTPDVSGNTRQKRRRTSPHDHAVLEEAYRKNIKPDKVERAEIVKQVTLGEKEVQIWFQNRRQNDRRRSRPLLPHELVPHFRNNVPKEILAHSVSKDKLDALEGNEGSVLERPASAQSVHSHVSIHNLLNPTSSSEDQQECLFNEVRSRPPTPQETPPSSLRNSEGMSSGSPGVEVTGSGKKRRHEEMSEANSQDNVKPVEENAESASKSSLIRLSMTTDGVMKVKTTLEDTPSPPKERAVPPTLSSASKRLQRSKSAIEDGLLFRSQDSDQSGSSIPRRSIGRSRDPRTWEFYCDSKARVALSSHAEAERSGSAVGAINLIRSQSQKSRTQALIPKPTRANSRVGVNNLSSSKPKLSRVQSSMGRLQGLDASMESKGSKTGSLSLVRSPSDSDKENWAPGTRDSINPLRRTQTSSSRQGILIEEGLRGGSGHHKPYDRAHQRPQHKKDTRSEMVVASVDKEKDKGADLDCVQGLLSLSQGAWK